MMHDDYYEVCRICVFKLCDEDDSDDDDLNDDDIAYMVRVDDVRG